MKGKQSRHSTASHSKVDTQPWKKESYCVAPQTHETLKPLFRDSPASGRMLLTMCVHGRRGMCTHTLAPSPAPAVNSNPKYQTPSFSSSQNDLFAPQRSSWGVSQNHLCPPWLGPLNSVFPDSPSLASPTSLLLSRKVTQHPEEGHSGKAAESSEDQL